MQTTLNFSNFDINRIKDFLNNFESKKLTSKYEEAKFLYKDCTITLYKSGKILIQGQRHKEVANEIVSFLANKENLLVGIDEVGRGEHKGPFVIAAVYGDENKFRFVRDSKKTSNLEKARELIEENALAIITYSLNAEFVDRMRNKGKTMNEIEELVIETIADFFNKLEPDVKVIVDGNPLNVKNEKIIFLVKADDINPVVSAASVMAKSVRENSKDKKERLSWRKE